MDNPPKIENLIEEDKKLISEKRESDPRLEVKLKDNEQKFPFTLLTMTQTHIIQLQKQNEELKKEVEMLKSEISGIKSSLPEITKSYKEKRKKKTPPRKPTNQLAEPRRGPKRSPMDSQIYNQLIKESSGSSYTATRTRVSIYLLTLTGLSITDLLQLKVKQLEALLTSDGIVVPRPIFRKTYLTEEGKKILEARKKDFEFLFAMKKKDSYVFTSDRNAHKSIRRETMTINLNKVMQSVSKNLPEKTKISTHSFRIGYISQLWQETTDIELVRHVLSPDHPFNYTTVRELTEEERADLISG